MLDFVIKTLFGERQLKASRCLTLRELSIGDKFVFFRTPETEHMVLFTKVKPYTEEVFGRHYVVTCKNYLGFSCSMPLDSRVLRIRA